MKRWSSFPGVLWNVEIKTIQALSSVIRVLEKHQAGHRIIVTSFRHDLVALCASSLKVNCGLLLAHRPRTLDSLLADFNCDGNPRINHVVWDYDVLDDILLKQTASDGFRNFVYGADHPSGARLLSGTGCGRHYHGLSASSTGCIAARGVA